MQQRSVPVFGYRVVATYPHDTDAFTQGLVYRDGELLESTGLHGRSSIRRVALESGSVRRKLEVPRRYFHEGIVDWEDRLIGITYRASQGFVYRIDDFSVERTFSYSGEGWGLTRDDRRLIMSDGTATLRFLDPNTFEAQGRLAVTLDGQPLRALNELEMIEGEIFANVWQSNYVVRIAVDSGQVTSIVDLSGLLESTDVRRGFTDVLNGIAWDAAGRRLFVTGKRWPKLFQIELVAR
ncbi:MAG: glutaminyl-peptide cyclotransferase [Myxococcota bacterium]